MKLGLNEIEVILQPKLFSNYNLLKLSNGNFVPLINFKLKTANKKSQQKVFVEKNYCSDFRYESNGIFVFGVGFFFFRQISTF